MEDDDKPYICIRNGWAMQITPRNRQGWLGLLAWLAVLSLFTAIFVAVVATGLSAPAMIAANVVFLLVCAAWAVVMIRWMMARSIIVSSEDIAQFKREQRRRKGE